MCLLYLGYEFGTCWDFIIETNGYRLYGYVVPKYLTLKSTYFTRPTLKSGMSARAYEYEILNHRIDKILHYSQIYLKYCHVDLSMK